MADPTGPEASKSQDGPDLTKQPEKIVKEIEKASIKAEKELPEKLSIKPEKEKESFKIEKPEIKEKHEKEKHEKESKLEVKEKLEKEKHEKEAVKEKNEKPEIEKQVVKPEKEHLEKLAIKPELEKQVIEGPKTIEGPGPVETLEGRLAAVEKALGELQHFIKPADRPDLSQGALTNEDDVPPQQ
jgi:hypothetical protein